jgi:DNA mismatch repair protein MutS
MNRFFKYVLFSFVFLAMPFFVLPEESTKPLRFNFPGESQDSSDEKKEPSIYEKLYEHSILGTKEEKGQVADRYDPKKLKFNSDINPLLERSLRSTIFSIFSSDQNISQENSEISTELTWKDLEVFCGGALNNREKHLFAKLDKTETAFGRVVLTRMLSDQTTDIKTLEQRQSIVKELINDNELFQEIDSSLKKFGEVEPLAMTLWQKEGALAEQLMQGLYGDANEGMKKNTTWLGFISRMRDVGISIYMIGFGGFGGLCAFMGLKNFSNHQYLKGSGLLLYGGVILYAASLLFKMEKMFIDLTKYMQQKLIYISHALKRVNEVRRCVEQNPVLKDSLELIDNTKLLLQFNAKYEVSNDFAKLIRLLNKKTFSKDKASYSSSPGNILAAFHLMQKVGSKLAPVLEAVGEIDAYMSAAKLYKEFEAQPVKYCFVDFVEDAEQPSVELENFWFPSLLHHQSPEQIVPNTIVMGSEQDKSPNAILTGPNTAGKSTILKGLVTCLLFGQTFGLAPASKAVFTPFSKIQTYMNVADNSAEGESLFKAELNRAGSLIKTIKGLDKKEFSFTILDEIFNGTSAEEAILGSGYIADTLIKQSNSMCIIATHFRMLTELENLTDGAFKNSKVSVIRESDGTLTFPYELSDGISDQHVAIDLIKQEEAFDKSELADKLEVLIKEHGVR